MNGFTSSTLALLGVFTLSVFSSQEKDSFPVDLKNRINIFQPQPDYRSQLPEVHGIRKCGGIGKIISIRLENCEPEKTCQFPADNEPIRWENELVPTKDANGLGVRQLALIGGKTLVFYDRAVANSEVKGGEPIVLSGIVAVGKELKGMNITTQYFIYSIDDNHVETCVESDYQFI